MLPPAGLAGPLQASCLLSQQRALNIGGSLPPPARPPPRCRGPAEDQVEGREPGQPRKRSKGKKLWRTLGLFLTLVYLKNKKPKKKKKTNFIYKVKLKPQYGKRRDLWGTGKKAGPEPIPHSEHGEPGDRGAGFFWQVWGGWNSVHWQQPSSESSLALSPFLQRPREALPSRTCSCNRQDSCRPDEGALTPAKSRICFFRLLASDLMT